MDVVKKRKMSCREIAEQFKTGKTQAANVVKNEASLRAEYENFHMRTTNILKKKTIKNTKLSTQFCTNGLKTEKLLESL